MQHMQKQAFARAIEIKGEDDDPVELVTKSLEDLESKVGDRIKAVEEKADNSKLTERLEKLEAKANRPSGGGGGDDDAAAIEKKSLNRFLRNGVAALDDAEQKALNWGTDSAGGYVTAPEYSTRVITKLTEFSPLRSVARVTAIGGNHIFYPVNSAKLSGGWVTETGERPESQPAFEQVKIEVFEHAVTVPISRQLLEDSFIDLQGFVSDQIAEQFGKEEGAAFINGDGDGKPLGFLDDPTKFVQVDAEQGGGDLVPKLIQLFYKLPTTYAMRGTWMMNRETMGRIREASDASDSRGTLWSDGLADGTPARFLGRPVAEAPDMAGLASTADPAEDTFPVAFGDWATAYQIIDRVGIQLMRDDYTGADNGIVKIRARRRVGGKLVQPEAAVLLKGAA